MSSIPKENVQPTSSVARQPFLDASPSETAHESKAKDVEDIPPASADEDKEDDQKVIPPASETVMLEEEVIESMEVETNVAATTNTTEANDTVMAEDNVEPEANVVPEAQEQPDATVNAEATVPPPRPHTIEQAYNRGELVTVRWPIMVPPIAPGPQYDYHVEQRPQVQKPKPRLPRLPGAATSPGSFSVNSFRAHNTCFDSTKNPYTKPKISSDRFWSYPHRNYYSCILYNQEQIFQHMHLDCEAIACLPALRKLLTASRKLVFYSSSLTKSTGMKSFCCSSMPHFTFVATTGIRRLGSLSG